MIAVADAVEHIGVVGKHLPRTEGYAGGMGGLSSHEPLEPLRLGEGIGVEQRNQRCVGRVDSAVAGGGEAEVGGEPPHLGQAVEPHIGCNRTFAGGGGTIGARVVDHEDPRWGERLVGEARQAAEHVQAAAMVDDDDRDGISVCGHSIDPRRREKTGDS